MTDDFHCTACISDLLWQPLPLTSELLQEGGNQWKGQRRAVWLGCVTAGSFEVESASFPYIKDAQKRVLRGSGGFGLGFFSPVRKSRI